MRTGITRFEDKAAKTARSFCSRCGTPLLYERARSPHMVNIPRALFLSRTGRQPLYHIGIEEMQEWTYSRRAAGSAQGLSGRGVGALWKEEARRARQGVLSSKSTRTVVS